MKSPKSIFAKAVTGFGIVYVLQLCLVVWFRIVPLEVWEGGEATCKVYKGDGLGPMIAPIAGLFVVLMGEEVHVVIARPGADLEETIVYEYYDAAKLRWGPNK